MDEAVGRAHNQSHEQRHEIPSYHSLLFLRPQHDPAGRAGRDPAIGFLRVAKATCFRNRRGAVVSRHKSRCQRLQYLGRGREVAL
jgi:hypothetical protein